MDPGFQLVLAMSVPTLAVLLGILLNNNRFHDVNNRFQDLNGPMGELNNRKMTSGLTSTSGSRPWKSSSANACCASSRSWTPA
jgi:hypothetical protein